MDYDFNMKQLLADFDGNADELANHFMDALKNELANGRTPEENVRLAAEDVTYMWNDYIHFYIQQLGYKENPNDFLINPDNVIAFTEAVLKVFPILKKYLNKDKSCECNN